MNWIDGETGRNGYLYNGIVEVVGSIPSGSTIETLRETWGFRPFWAYCLVPIFRAGTASGLAATERGCHEDHRCHVDPVRLG